MALLAELRGGLLGLSPVKLPRGSSSESEASHWTPTQELRRAIEQRPITNARPSQPAPGDPKEDAAPVAHALQQVECAHEALEAVKVTEGLLALHSEAHRAAAAQALQDVANLAHAQAFQLDARRAVDGWVASACADLPAADANCLRELAAGLQVEAHEAVAVDMTAQGGGSALQRQAAVSFYHAFQSWVKGADGVCSPAWVTAELRCTADFRSAGQSDASSAPVESLIIGIDVEWQAQPLGPAKGRHPTVGAKSMPDFLVAQTGGKAGKAARNQAPDADKLQRLQALLGVARLPPRTFLAFLLLVTLAPGGGGGGGDSCSVALAGGHKRRRVAAEHISAVPSAVQRAIALTDAMVREAVPDDDGS